MLPPVLRRVRAGHPESKLVVVTGDAPEIARAVIANTLDGIASLSMRDRELTTRPFYRGRVGGHRPAASRVAPPAHDGAAELAREPLILFERGSTQRRVVEDWFHRGGVLDRRLKGWGTNS